jgi:serine/threonine-protein kinase HipA
MVNVIEVNLWETQLGALGYDSSTGLSTFEYSDEWIKKYNCSISPINIPCTKKRKFTFGGLNPATYRGLPGAFADTLPDDFGNAVLDAWLSQQGRGLKSLSPLERLLYQGSRGMGAIEYAPQKNISGLGSHANIQIDSLTEMAQQVLNKRSGLIKNVKEDKSALLNLLQVGTSAGGARPKAVIGLNKDRTEVRSGQVKLPKGFDYFLMKFDGVIERSTSSETFGDPKGFGRMEYAYYLMAKDCGINMSFCDMLFDGDRAHFITQRFDRVNGDKIHMQSLCAMDHADYKMPGYYSYEQLFGLMRQLEISYLDAEELLRRMIFNIVARNHDDHTKNFSFLMNKDGSWSLSPAYDIAYSYRLGSEWVDQHQLSLNGRRDQFTREDIKSSMAAISPKLGKEVDHILDQTIMVVSNWHEYSDKAGVFEELSREIKLNLRLNLKK